MTLCEEVFVHRVYAQNLTDIVCNGHSFVVSRQIQVSVGNEHKQRDWAAERCWTFPRPIALCSQALTQSRRVAGSATRMVPRPRFLLRMDRVSPRFVDL